MSLEVLDYRTDVRNVFISPEIRSRFQRLEPGTVTPMHTHDFGHEVWVVMEGEVESEIAGERAVVRPGQMVVARTDEPHALRVVGERPATVYLSVTPHLMPTHTFWDGAGNKLPPRYSRFTTRREGEPLDAAPAEPLAALADRQVAAARELAAVAAVSAEAQAVLAGELKLALAAADAAGAKAAVDAMSERIAETYRRFQVFATIWNELAPRSAPPSSGS